MAPQDHDATDMPGRPLDEGSRSFKSTSLRQRVWLVEIRAGIWSVRRAHAPFALLKRTGETHQAAEVGDSAQLSLSAKMAVDFSDSPDALVSSACPVFPK